MIARGIAFLIGTFATLAAFAQDYPQPTTVITPEQPLFLYRVSPVAGWSEAAGTLIADRFDALPDSLRPFSAVVVHPHGAISAEFENAVEILGQRGIPTAVQVADTASKIDPSRIARLLEDYSGVVGVVASGLQFDRYDRLSGVSPYSTPPTVRWTLDAIDASARYGRRFMMELDGVNTARLMANQECAELMQRIRTFPQHITPVARIADQHAIAGLMSAMGLWLEESVETFGVAASDEWYANAPYLEPAVFGANAGGDGMPPSFYRAMVLNGIMTGATVCIIEPERALWFAEDPAPWRRVVQPTLEEIVGKGLIPRRDFVQRKAQVGLQLLAADSPSQFRLNLRDLDATLDAGLLILGAYGLEQPGLVHELIPNSGRHYWVPVLSPSAPENVLKRFARVVPAATMMTAEEWTGLLDRVYQPDGAGTAFISRIGRAVFVMHTRENRYEQQTYRLPRLPAPVYGVSGERIDGGVQISWPFREDDFAYRVYKRSQDQSSFELAAEVNDNRSWIDNDAPAELDAAYAVTAFTDEGAPHEGTVNYGDYIVFSTIESRIAEAIEFAAGSETGVSRRSMEDQDNRPLAQSWWPGGESPPPEFAQTANEIAGRLVDWGRSFQAEDLGGIMNIYASNYVDPQGWGTQYVRRAYQWFFERYDRCGLHTQVRTWDFSKAAEGEVAVRVFVRGTGIALTDNTGTRADIQVRFPRTADQETVLVFRNYDGGWRIARTDPALPNMRELLSFSLGPDNRYAPGPDVYPQ